jgi:bifunctional UDP-N-acetylglucosamine pyrophosphorylase/glucosamine-1-phosphate N-acetyltransferase
MSGQPTLIILAGGASSRMYPLREKSLIRFGADPLLIRQLRRFVALGFDRAILVANPENKGVIADLLATMTDPIQTDVVVQPEPIGMGDALLKAQPLLADAPDAPIYITQVHDVVDDQLHQDILAAYHQHLHGSYIAGYEMEDYFPGGYLTVNHEGRISGIIEKPDPDKRPSNLVNIVAHLHSNSGRLFDAIQAQYDAKIASDDHYERAMASLMDEHIYRVVPYKGHWSALKFPWHVLDVMRYFLGQIQGQVIESDAYIAPSATLSGNVYIGAGAKIFPHASIVGPAYIGARTIVGNGALVRESMVLNHCEVGFTTEVARSYVADYCSMHASRVLDSVFAEGVNFSAGCTTANLRIDKGEVQSTVKGKRMGTGRNKLGAIIGRDAFISVDAMTMPGVKIGEQAQVGPGTHVHEDIEAGKRVYVKQELIIKD